MANEWRVERLHFTPHLREHYPIYDGEDNQTAIVFPVEAGYDEDKGEPILSPTNAVQLVALWNNRQQIVAALKYLAVTLDMHDGFLKDKGGRQVVELLERLGKRL